MVTTLPVPDIPAPGRKLPVPYRYVRRRETAKQRGRGKSEEKDRYAGVLNIVVVESRKTLQWESRSGAKMKKYVEPGV